MMAKYHCEECGLAVIVTGGVAIKACNCVAPIIAEMSATAEGKSSVAVKKPAK
jgi:hypothetical protein